MFSIIFISSFSNTFTSFGILELSSVIPSYLSLIRLIDVKLNVSVIFIPYANAGNHPLFPKAKRQEKVGCIDLLELFVC